MRITHHKRNVTNIITSLSKLRKRKTAQNPADRQTKPRMSLTAKRSNRIKICGGDCERRYPFRTANSDEIYKQTHKTRARPSGSRPYKTKRFLHLKSFSTHGDPYVNQFPNKIKRVFHIIVRAKEMRLRFCVHADVVHEDGVPSAGATIRAKRSRHVKGCRNLRHSKIAEPRSSRLRIPHACGIERIRDELIRPVPRKLPRRP